MGRNQDNPQKVKKEGFKLHTKNNSKKWNVNYNELIMESSLADVLVDDKCIFFKKNWYNYINKKL